MFAAALIAVLTFFFDPRDRDRSTASSRVLIGVLFAVLINMLIADATSRRQPPYAGYGIHLVALALIVVIALLALRDRRRADHDLPVRYPTGRSGRHRRNYVAINGGLITHAAWH